MAMAFRSVNVVFIIITLLLYYRLVGNIILTNQFMN